MLWDLVSLTNVATLKAHTDDINVLQKGTNILVSAGAAGFENDSLFVWDLRTSSPIEKREKASDIQCLQVCDDDKGCFIGNTAQMVKNIEFNYGQSIALDPPHEDVVTCLSKFRGIIVSGSKDRSMRFWDASSKQLMYNESNAHQNAITCMSSDEDYIYTGCKDNIVKAWQFKELSKDQYSEQLQDKENSKESDLEQIEEEFGKYKAEVSSYMIGHNSQINSICTMNDQKNSIFTGGNDKSLKLWSR